MKLYCETREQADQTAAWVIAQRLEADVGQALAGWAVTVSGPSGALDDVEEHVRAQLRGSA